MYIFSKSEESSQVPQVPNIDIVTLDSISEGPHVNLPSSVNGKFKLNSLTSPSDQPKSQVSSCGCINVPDNEALSPRVTVISLVSTIITVGSSYG